MSEIDRFAGDLIRDLEQCLQPGAAPHRAVIERAVAFLRTRLTEAAQTSCHHCDQGETGTPCWWCGLANTNPEGVDD